MLLTLAQERKVDLDSISLAAITDDFLQRTRTMDIPYEQQADFAVVAAQLLLLKINRLLPQLEEPENESEQSSLVETLAVFRQIRRVTDELMRRWGTSPLRERAVPLRQAAISSLSSTELRQAMRGIQQRWERAEKKRTWLQKLRGRSLQDCMTHLQERLVAARQVVWQEHVARESRSDFAGSFLAVLELVKRGSASATQAGARQPLLVTQQAQDG